jgi:hypothetical protein
MKRARQTIKAGERGTKKLVKEFGSNLLNVRIYYDIKRKRKIRTIELLVDENEWVPTKINPAKIVKLKVNWGEPEIARKIKANGGIWNKEKKVWEIAFGKVKDLGLQSRMVK